MSSSDESDRTQPLPSSAGAPPEAKPPVDAPTEESAPDGAARPSVAPTGIGWREEVVGTSVFTPPSGSG